MTSFSCRRAFTFVELVMVVACLLALVLPLLQIFRLGTRSSVAGLSRVDTTLEGRRILRQLRTDLELLCFPPPETLQPIRLEDLLRVGGTAASSSFTFLSFPVHGPVTGLVSPAPSGKAPRRANRLTWRLEWHGSGNQTAGRLIREETFHPDLEAGRSFPGGVRTTVESERVRYFSIRPYAVGLPGEKEQQLFWIYLQLLDAPPGAVAPTPSSVIPEIAGITCADFFDTVSPDYFRLFWNHPTIRRNWYTGVEGPPESPLPESPGSGR